MFEWVGALEEGVERACLFDDRARLGGLDTHLAVIGDLFDLAEEGDEIDPERRAELEEEFLEKPVPNRMLGAAFEYRSMRTLEVERLARTTERIIAKDSRTSWPTR